jgi:hypothetical protein
MRLTPPLLHFFPAADRAWLHPRKVDAARHYRNFT